MSNVSPDPVIRNASKFKSAWSNHGKRLRGHLVRARVVSLADPRGRRFEHSVRMVFNLDHVVTSELLPAMEMFANSGLTASDYLDAQRRLGFSHATAVRFDLAPRDTCLNAAFHSLEAAFDVAHAGVLTLFRRR